MVVSALQPGKKGAQRSESEAKLCGHNERGDPKGAPGKMERQDVSIYCRAEIAFRDRIELAPSLCLSLWGRNPREVKGPRVCALRRNVSFDRSGILIRFLGG